MRCQRREQKRHVWGGRGLCSVLAVGVGVATAVALALTRAGQW
jgi:hypothetical protein